MEKLAEQEKLRIEQDLVTQQKIHAMKEKRA